MDQAQKATLRKYILISIASLLAITIMYVLFMYTIVTISPQTTASQDVTLKVSSLSTKKTKSYTIAAGDQKQAILRRGSYNVTATQGKSQTISSFEARALTINEVSVALTNEAAVSRIATGSLGCGKEYSAIYYSHRCSGDIRIFKHTKFQGNNRASTALIGASSTYRSAIQLNNGVLGIVDDQEGGIDIEFVELPSEKVSEIAVDFIGSKDDTGGYTLVANTSRPGEYEFAVVNQKTGVWHLYKNIEDNQPLKRITTANIPDIEKYSMINQSNQLTGNTLVSLYDVDTEGGEGTNKTSREVQNRNVALVTNTKSSLTTSYPLPDTRKYEAVWQSDATHLVGETIGGQAVIYDISGDEAKKVAEYDNVTVLNIYKSSTLIGINRGIYKMSPDGSTLSRLFESEHLTLSSITRDSDGVEFTAFVNERNPLYTLPDTYRLSLDQKAVYPQDQEFLPYTSNMVRSMDYNDSQIQVQLALTSLSFSRTTGQADYDPAEFQDLAYKVRAELSKKNLIRGREILFTY